MALSAGQLAACARRVHMHNRSEPVPQRASHVVVGRAPQRPRHTGRAALRAMPWVSDVVVGALTPGLNHPTIVLLNIVIGLVFLTLLYLLHYSVTRSPPLTPHFIALLCLCLGLWASVNWVAANIGLVDAQEQQKQLLVFTEGGSAGGPTAEGANPDQPDAADKEEEEEEARKER